MSRTVGDVFGPGHILYGSEWRIDKWDRHIDKLRSEHEKPLDLASGPRIAVVIGCGSGTRVFDLAKKGHFDEVVGCDLKNPWPFLKDKAEQLSAFQQAAGFATGRRRTVIRPLEANVIDLDLSHFGGVRADYVDFRNVPQFLAPSHLLKSMEVLRDIAAERAVISMTFNCIGGSKFWNRAVQCSLDDTSDPAEFYTLHKSMPHAAAYGEYDPKDVTRHMEGYGFTILPSDPNAIEAMPDMDGDMEIEDMRYDEHHIAALAPGHNPIIARTHWHNG